MSGWIFGYGSLIWRPDFDFLERRPARVRGWQRRFWQGSHDHRGLPHQPGRVVTLVETPGAWCDGMAYRVDEGVLERTVTALDHREKNGYLRRVVWLEFGDRALESAPTEQGVEGVVYIAATDNHAYLGPAPLPEMARQIIACAGPSGRNLDYLLDLAQALRALGSEDRHVFELEAAARELHAQKGGHS